MTSGFGMPAVNLYGMIKDVGDSYFRGQEEFRRRELAKQIGVSLKGGDYAGAASLAFDGAEPETGLQLLKLGETVRRDRRQEENLKALGPLLGGLSGSDDYGDLPSNPIGGGAATVGPSPSSSSSSRAIPTFTMKDGPIGDYLAGARMRESGGNDQAKNPNSTATGRYQFIESTWNGLRKKYPELGLTPDGRTDPAQQERAMAAFTKENEGLLRQSNLPVNSSTLYSLHLLGPSGRRLVAGTLANPDRPAINLVNPDQAAANKSIFYRKDGSPKTAGEVMGDFSRSFGGSAPAPTSRRVQVAALGDVSGLGMPGSPAGPVPSMSPERQGGGGLQPQQVAALGHAGGGISPPSPVANTASTDAVGSRVMTMPGAPGSASPVSEADIQALDRPTAARIRATQGLQPSQRLTALGQIMTMDLPEGAQRVVTELYRRALDDTKMPDGVREFMWARRQGLTQARTPAEYARESKGPTTLAPGSSVLAPDGRSIALTAPDRSNTKVSDEIAAREQALIQRGEDPNSPQNRQWVLSGKWPREDAQPLTATDKKAVLEADEGVMTAETAIGNLRQAKAISKQAYAGPYASERGTISGYFGSTGGLATTELDNLVTTNALSQLKAIFGAAPTEGERKILLDIQGSSSLPDAARQKIYDRAIAMAERRLGMNRERVNELRGGTFFRPGGGESSPASGAPSSRALPAPAPSNRPGAASASDRFGELTARGMSKADAYRQLQSEGY